MAWGWSLAVFLYLGLTRAKVALSCARLPSRPQVSTMSLSDDGNGIAMGTKDGRLGLLRTEELVAKPEVRGPADMLPACLPMYWCPRAGQVPGRAGHRV